MQQLSSSCWILQYPGLSWTKTQPPSFSHWTLQYPVLSWTACSWSMQAFDHLSPPGIRQPWDAHEYSQCECKYLPSAHDQYTHQHAGQNRSAEEQTDRCTHISQHLSSKQRLFWPTINTSMNTTARNLECTRALAYMKTGKQRQVITPIRETSS